MATPIIYKGDDTDFAGRSDLAIRLDTDEGLDGCRVEFTFLGQRRAFVAAAGESKIPFVFTAAETATMPVGTHKAKVRVFDAQGRVRTVAEPRIKVTDDLKEAYAGADVQEIGVEVTTGGTSIEKTDVFDCDAGLSDLKERIAYLWEKCGGTVINRDALDYGEDAETDETETEA